MFNLFRLSRKYVRNFLKNSFDIVAKNGKNVEATFDIVKATVDFVEAAFDFVERKKSFDDCSIQHCCFDKLLLVWTGLKTGENSLHVSICPGNV